MQNQINYFDWLQEKFPWQLVADNFAYAWDVPLRIARLDKFANLFGLLKQHAEDHSERQPDDNILKPLLDQWRTKENFDNYVKQFVESWETVVTGFGQFLDDAGMPKATEVTEQKIHEQIEKFKESNQTGIKEFRKILIWRGHKKIRRLFESGFNFLDQNIWLTSPSYALPVDTASNLHSPWRWLTVLWFYHHFVLSEPAPKSTGDRRVPIREEMAFNIPHWYVLTRHLVSPGTICGKYCLVLGPVFTPGEIDTSKKTIHAPELLFEKRVQPALMLIRLFQHLSEDKALQANQSAAATVLPHADNTRNALLPEIAKTRLRNCILSLKFLFEVGVGGCKDYPWRHNDHTELIRCNIFLARACEDHRFYFIKPTRWYRILPRFFQAPFRFSCRLTGLIDNNDQQVEINCKLHLDLNRNTPFPQTLSCAALPTNPAGIKGPMGLITASLNQPGYQKIEKGRLAFLERKLIDLASVISTRQREHRLTNMGLLLTWLQQNFTVSIKQRIEVRRKRFYKDHRFLFRWVTELFGADLACLYSYHHAKEQLRIVSAWFRDRNDLRGLKQWQQQISDLDKKDWQSSTYYRAVEENAQQFTSACDHEAKICDPPGRPMLYFEKIPMHSSITTPLHYKGRLLGVLQISGKSVYQFGWETLAMKKQLCIALSPYFFHQRFVTALHRINKMALEVSKNTKHSTEIYTKISQSICAIFLCDGASLWLRDQQDQNRFHCVGAYNHPYLEKQVQVDPRSLGFCSTDPDSITAKEVFQDSTKPFMNYQLGRGSLDSRWLKSAPFRKALSSQHIQYLTIFPLRNEQGNNIGSVSLYNKHSGQYHNWDSLFFFIAKYLCITLEAAHVSDWGRAILKEQFSHEVIGAGKLYNEHYQKFIRLTSDLFNDPAKFADQLKNDPEKAQALKHKLHYLIKQDLKLQLKRLQDSYDQFIMQKQPPVDRITEAVNFSKRFQMAKSSVFGDSRSKHQKIVYTESFPGHNAPALLLMRHTDLQIILDNLIQNAVKHAPANATIEGFFGIDDGRCVFSIRNIGVPLHPEEEYLIFKEYYRGFDAKKLNIPGEGLGLAIVRQICDRYEADISYQSHPTGTADHCMHIFRLEFPNNLLDYKPGRHPRRR
jgi:two-component sensor histidine kinase